MERLHSGAASRKTEYEIVNADKYNPTLLAIKPVPKVKGYDPYDAYDWSIDQFDAVAKGRPIDQRLDAQDLGTIAEIAAPPKDGAYKRFWFKSDDLTVIFDESYSEKAAEVARKLRDLNAPKRWHVGVSVGEITGELLAVTDTEGEREFVITPPVGPAKIVCRFPEEKREFMNEFLFKVVTVTGKFHYGEESPHPISIDMTDICEKTPAPVHLLNLRGLFKGFEQPSAGGFQLLDG